jgi:tetratricopeptide (TPR) repeat protein
MRYLAMALLLALSALTARADDLADCTQSKDADRRIRGCTALMKMKKWEPWQMANMFLNRAQGHYFKGEHDLAIADCSKAIASRPLVDAYECRAAGYSGKGDYDRAIADFSVVIDSKPSAKAYHNRAYAHYQKNEFDDALKDLDRALKLDPTYERSIKLKDEIESPW